MNKLKILSFLCLFLLFCIPAAGNDYGRNHIIIALDEAGTGWRGIDMKVMANVGYYLFDNGGNPLLGDDDYYSVVGFKADCSGERWDDFVYIKKSPINGKQLSFVKSDSEIVKFTDSQYWWRRLAEYQGQITESFSLVSIAKPYVISALGNIENKPLVQHTYIILVTDHRYNGDDFYNELHYYMDKSGLGRRGLDIHKVLDVCYAVEEEFCIRYIGAKEWRSDYVGFYHNVELYEVCPNQEFLTLPAVIDYAPSVTAKRIRGGKYAFDLELKHSNHHFGVKKLVADLYKSDSTFRNVLSADSLSVLNKRIEFERKEKISYAELYADLLLYDGRYNATLLKPELITGLKQKIVIVKEEDAKFFFRLFPLPDFLWIPWIENQYVAAIVLDFLILILIVVSFVFYLKMSNTYKPKQEDIHIRFYE